MGNSWALEAKRQLRRKELYDKMCIHFTTEEWLTINRIMLRLRMLDNRTIRTDLDYLVSKNYLEHRRPNNWANEYRLVEL